MKIGIDIGGSHIGIGLVDGNSIIRKIEKDFAFYEKIKEGSNINKGEEVCFPQKEENKTKDVSYNTENKEMNSLKSNNKTEYLSNLILKYISDNIEKLMEEFEIEFIGIGAPGIVQENSFVNLVNLGLEKIDFSPIINKYKNVKFKLRNDSKSAGIAEHEIGSLKGYKDCVFLCLGTGIGSAVIMNDSLLKTRNGSGFELGHMVINKNGTTCNCGKRGCFETCCSIKRFKDNVKNILKLNEATSEEILLALKNNLQKAENISISGDLTKNINNLSKYKIRVGNNFVEAISIGDNSKKAEAINIKNNSKEKEADLIAKDLNNLINQYIEDLIIGLTNIIDIFEPEAIALGGSFVYYKEIFYEKLLEEMNKKMCVLNKKAIPKIVLAKLKNDAGIIGSTM